MYAGIVTYIRQHHVGLLALFIALGGTAWAAATINSKDVVDNSLKSVDLKDGKGVKGVDVEDESLESVDIKDEAVTGADVQDGSLGPADLAPGSDSGNVVTRAIGTTEQEVTNVTTEYPLTDNQWTQAVDETNFLYGRINVNPSPGDCDMSWSLVVDGQPASGFHELGTNEPRGNIPLSGPLFETGFPDLHVVTVLVFNTGIDCATDPNVVTSAQVNVIGFR